MQSDCAKFQNGFLIKQALFLTLYSGLEFGGTWKRLARDASQCSEPLKNIFSFRETKRSALVCIKSRSESIVSIELGSGVPSSIMQAIQLEYS